MNELFNDKSTYIKIDKDPLKDLQNDVKNILQYLNENNYLYQKYKNNHLTQTNTVLARAYGLLKIHKVSNPCRPVISLINSPTYMLAKFLYDDLKKGIKLPESHVKNSLELKNKIKHLVIPDNYILLSLDVSALFTNIPCNLVVNSLDRRVTEINKNCFIPYSDIVKCTRFLFDNSYFVFNKVIYKQVYGTAMGSPISCLYADIVMNDLEQECLRILDNH